MKLSKNVIITLILVFALTFPILSVLTIREQQTKQILWMFIKPDKIAVEWIHSVELEPWRETHFITPDNKLLLVESRFKAFGAGVPDNGADEFYVEDGWFVMKGFHRVFEDLPIQVSCFSDHHVIVQQQAYYLCDKVKDGDFVTIKAEKVSLIRFLSHYLLEEEEKHE